MALAATLHCPPSAGIFCSEVPEDVQALLDATEGIWTGSSSSSEASESPPEAVPAQRSATMPLLPRLDGAGAAPETAAPPGLEGERMVRRVSLRRQSRQLQVPGQDGPQIPALKRSNFLTAPTPQRSVTISEGSSSPPHNVQRRSFTVEEPASYGATPWNKEQLQFSQQMAQLQLQQFQMQQMSQYDVARQQQMLLQYQMSQMQMRTQSLMEPGATNRPPEDSRSLRRTVSAAAGGSPTAAERAARAEPGAAMAMVEGRSRRRKSMREIAAEVASAESDAELLMAADEVEIILGPTEHAVLPLSFEKLWINDDASSVKSRSNHLSVSDVLQLKAASSNQVRSFGSLLHSCGTEASCRPCMFERVPGRCKKAWLCDFCHLHSGRKKKKGPADGPA